ncbi:MAG: serine--tRNA ligase [Verrucomicrobiota bacterium]
MIDIKEVLKDPNKMRANINARCSNVDLDAILEKRQSYLKQIGHVESLQFESNNIAKSMKTSAAEDRPALIAKGQELKRMVGLAKEGLNELDEALDTEVRKLPNFMSEDVPIGTKETDNKIISTFGEPTTFNFKPLDHLELGQKLDLIDFESGAKVTGTKFYFLKNQAVLLQHAIKSFVFKKAIEQGFTPLQAPDIARNNILEGVGFVPRGDESNTYEIAGMDMSLVATAEISVGGMHSDEIIDIKKLPLLYAAESHCFRREAGTAGKASKGLYRVHQFEKIELFALTLPQQSEEIHEKIRSLEESIYQDLEIPYQVVLNCSADLGAPAYKKYDIEAWMPGKGDAGEYGEVTSASNCTDFQARRLKIRYKNPNTGKNQFVHTLNGTASALGRTMIVLMENYQNEEGGIRIPRVLKPYTGFDMIAPIV